MSKLVLPLVALAGFVGVATVEAQIATPSTPDVEFARKAASGGHAEVELGRMALGKSTNVEVRQFAQRMVKDHTRANLELSELAQSQHLLLPRVAEGEDAANIKRLGGLSGSAFDRAYMDLMVEDHQHDVADFGKEADQGQNAQIKTLARTLLPTLQEHLQLAQQVQRGPGEEKAQLPSER